MAVYTKWARIQYGTLTVGKDDYGHDVKFYGAASGNYLHWDESGDDLLLVGTATQLAVAGTTDATDSVTGSLRTAGGLGVAKAANIGTTLTVAGAVTLSSTVAVTGATTLSDDVTLAAGKKTLP